MNRGSWRWYLLVGAVATVPIVAIPDSWWYTAWYDTIGLSAVAAVLIGVRGNRPRTPMTWWWLAAGQLLFVVGDLLFDLHERVWHTDAFPSSADGFYLAGYVPLAVGLVLLIRARTPGRDRASLIDATIIATGLGLLSWVFLMKPAAIDSTLTVVGRVIAIAYPAADVLLLALVARLLVGAGVHNTAFRLLAGSLLVMLAGDVGFAVLAQADAFTANNAINTTWLLAYVLFGAAALHPSMAALSQRAPERPRRLTRRRLSLLTGVSLVAPILLLGQTWGRDGIDAAALGIGSIALFRWRWPCWISTTSNGSTTSTATRPATSSSRAPPRPGSRCCARATCWPATAGRSSRYCFELDPRPGRRDRRPAPGCDAAGPDVLGRGGPVERGRDLRPDRRPRRPSPVPGQTSRTYRVLPAEPSRAASRVHQDPARMAQLAEAHRPSS